MTINGHSFETKGRTILHYVEDWVTEELHVVFTNGTYLETHGDTVLEGTLQDKSPQA